MGRPESGYRGGYRGALEREKVVGAEGFEPPTSCSQSIDEGAELPSFWDALTGETARDEERWLPRWLPQATQPVFTIRGYTSQGLRA